MTRNTFIFTVILLCVFALSSCCTTCKCKDTLDDIQVDADEFCMLQDGTVEAKGNVRIISKKLTIDTSKIVYNRKGKTAVLDGPVIITLTNMTANAKPKQCLK